MDKQEGGITLEQSQSVMALLMNNTDWKSINFNGSHLQELVMRDPKGAGKRFTTFLKNGCHSHICHKLILPEGKLKLNDGHLDLLGIRPGWSTWKGPIYGDGLQGEELVDFRSQALKELCVSRLIFDSGLSEDETVITGVEAFLRHENKKELVRLGIKAAVNLRKDHKETGENSILEFVHREQKINQIHFHGFIIRWPDNPHPHNIYFYRVGPLDWRCACNDLSANCGRHDFVALSRVA